MDRLDREAEEDERTQEERMSGQDAEGKTSEVTIKKEVIWKVREKEEEKGKGKKRRWIICTSHIAVPSGLRPSACYQVRSHMRVSESFAPY
jgi:hypothetical protein